MRVGAIFFLYFVGSSYRLTEIGPRMTLQLVKIEEGIGGGDVLYHEFIQKTDDELQSLTEMRERKRCMMNTGISIPACSAKEVFKLFKFFYLTILLNSRFIVSTPFLEIFKKAASE